MEFGQDGSPWGTTGRDQQNEARLLCFFEGIQEYKAMPTAIQIKFTQLLRWILQTVPETFTARTLLPSVPDST